MKKKEQKLKKTIFYCSNCEAYYDDEQIYNQYGYKDIHSLLRESKYSWSNIDFHYISQEQDHNTWKECIKALKIVFNEELSYKLNDLQDKIEKRGEYDPDW